MKVNIKSETIKANGYREFVADGDMNGVAVQVFATSHYANNGLTIMVKAENGRKMTTEEYAAVGVTLDTTGIEEEFKAAATRIAAEEEAKKQEQLREKRKTAYADSIHAAPAAVLESAGFTTDKQSLDEFVNSPRSYLKATKNGEYVEVFEDKNYYVASIGYSRDDKKKTSKIDKIPTIADDMLKTKKYRKEQAIRTANAEEARNALSKSIIGENAVVDYNGSTYITLSNGVTASTKGKNFDKFALTLNGLTEEQIRAVMGFVRGM